MVEVQRVRASRTRPARPARDAAGPRGSGLPRFELIGAPGAPVIVALGGISATRHVASSPADPSSGWWEEIVGPGRAIDTTAFRVLSFDWVDGGRGPGGRPGRRVTTHDQAAALAAVLDELGVERAHAVVGASYGGMVALAFAERFRTRLERLVVLSAAHESHPMTTGLRALQRRIVELGLETGRGTEALGLARGLAMTTYRTAREFAERFDNAPVLADDAAGDVTFDVERYLRHCGARFAATWRPERFLALSLSMDLHRVDPAAITTPAVLVAAEGDTLVPDDQIRALASRLAGPVELITVPTRYGHDAFLAEPVKIGRILSAALSDRILS